MSSLDLLNARRQQVLGGGGVTPSSTPSATTGSFSQRRQQVLSKPFESKKIEPIKIDKTPEPDQNSFFNKIKNNPTYQKIDNKINESVKSFFSLPDKGIKWAQDKIVEIASQPDFKLDNHKFLNSLSETQKFVETSPVFVGEYSPLSGLEKGATAIWLGNSEEVAKTLYTRLPQKKTKVGEGIETVGEFVGAIGAMMAGGSVLRAAKFGKATLPVLFTVVGQTGESADLDWDKRLAKVPVDAVAGYLFSLIPGNNPFTKAGLKEAGAAGTVAGTQTFINSLTKGMDEKEAAEASIRTAIIGALFHMAFTATNSEFKKGNTTMTPAEAKAKSVEMASNPEMKGPAANLFQAAEQAEAAGKNIEINLFAARKSPIAEMFKMNTPEGISGSVTLVDPATPPTGPQAQLGGGATPNTPASPESAITPLSVAPTAESSGFNAALASAKVGDVINMKDVAVEAPTEAPATVTKPAEVEPPKTRGTIKAEGFPEGAKGIVSYRPDGTAGISIHIDGKLQSQGIGTKIYKQLEQKAVAQGIKTFTAQADLHKADGGKTSVPFWEKMGFELDGPEKGEFQPMKKELSTELSTAKEPTAQDIKDLNKPLNQKNSKLNVEKTLAGEREDLRLDNVKNIDNYRQTINNPTATPDTMVTIYRGGKGEIKVGDFVTTELAIAEDYVSKRPGASILTQEVALRDLVPSGGQKREFIYAPKSAVKVQESKPPSPPLSPKKDKAPDTKPKKEVTEEKRVGDDEEYTQEQIEEYQRQMMDEVKDELGDAENLPDDSPTKVLLDIADRMGKHFKAPGALFKITGNPRVYTDGEGNEIMVGGTAVESFDRLIFSTDIDGFGKNIKVLASKFNKSFTILSDTISSGAIDGGDYEKFKEAFREQLSKRPTYSAGSRGSNEAGGKVKGTKPSKKTPERVPDKPSDVVSDGKKIFTEQADVLAKTDIAKMSKEDFVKSGLEYYKTTDEYKNTADGDKGWSENVTRNDLLKHYRNVVEKFEESITKTKTDKPSPIANLEEDLPEQRMVFAYNGTSFNPDRRAKQEIEQYVGYMTQDYEDLAKLADTPEKKKTLDEMYAKYREGMKKRRLAIADADSRTMSSMITGPARFPVEKNRQKMEIAQKRYEEFMEYSQKGLARIKNELNPTTFKGTTPKTISKMEEKLGKLKNQQTQMKAANKIIKSKTLSKNEKLDKLEELGMVRASAETLFEPDFMGNIGFPAYQLTSINGQIKRLQKRVDITAAKREKADTTGNDVYKFDGGEVLKNYDENRLQILFDEKPGSEMIDKLKGRGFRWSPKNKAWQRILTLNAQRDAKRILGEVTKVEKTVAEEPILKVQELPKNKEEAQTNMFGVTGEGELSKEDKARLAQKALADARGKVKDKLTDKGDALENTPLGASVETPIEEMTGSKYASKELYTEEQRTEKETQETRKIIEFPEMIRLVKQITGELPILRKMNKVKGRFNPITMAIKLNYDLFENETQAARTLAHEIGHLVDFIGKNGNTMARGNLLGRLASLNSYRKNFISEKPPAEKDLITAKDRSRLRRLAKRMAKEPVEVTKEVVVGETKIDPQEVLAIWKDNTVGKKDPALLKYIQTLSDADKVSIAKAALKGIIPDWVKFTRKEFKTITVKELRKAPADIRAKYKELLKEEIRKRNLVSKDIITEELRELSFAWRPLSGSTQQSYINYRNSPSELYADAISVLFNDPVRLQEDAPVFYRTFFNYLDNKPAASEAFFDAWSLLNKGEDEVLGERLRTIDEMFENDEEKFRALQEERKETKRDVAFQLKHQFINKNQLVLDKLKEAKAKGVEISDDDNPKYLLSEYNYLGGKIKSFLDLHINPWYSQLEENGITWEEVGKYMMLERIMDERKNIANPLGLTKNTAKPTFDKMVKDMGEEKAAALADAVSRFRAANKMVMEDAYERGQLYSKELYDQIKDNETYASFRVTEYLDSNVSAKIFKQVGTFKDVGNPATITLAKMIATIRATERSVTNRATIDLLKKAHPKDIEVAPTKWNGKTQAPVKSTDPRKELVLNYEKGKAVGYYVDPYIAESFGKMNLQDRNIVVELLRLSNNKLYRPLFISLNLRFQIRNFVRDFIRSYKNSSVLNPLVILKSYYEAMPAAKKRAFGGFDQTINDMEAAGMLGATYNDSLKGVSEEDKQIDLLFDKYVGREGVEAKNPVAMRLKKILDAIERTGNFVETLPKVAGYLRMSDELSPKELGYYVRNMAGSPDFLTNGSLFYQTSAIQLFSNATGQGWRGDYESFTDPKTRSGYWFKSAVIDFLPKILMWAMKLGLFGALAKKSIEGISEYNLSHYNAIPLGIDENGKTLWVPLVSDQTGQFFSGLAWKTLNIMDNKPLEQGIMDIFAYLGSSIPGLSPAIEALSTTKQYIEGQNPYDSYRNRGVIPDTEFEAGGWARLKPFLIWQLQSNGGAIIWPSSSLETGQNATYIEKFLNAPIIGGIAQTFLRVSDYGHQEVNKKIATQEAREEARVRLDNRELIDRSVKRVREGEDRGDVMRSMIEEVKNRGEVNADTLKQIKSIQSGFELSLVKDKRDPNINSLIYASTNSQKAKILKNIKDTSSEEDFNNILRNAMMNGVISDDVLIRLKGL